MRRMAIVGIHLAAILAIGAMMASGAQAAELVSCVKAPKHEIEYEKNGKTIRKAIHEGQYANRTCTQRAAEKTGRYPGYEGPEGKFERGAVGAHFTTASHSFRLKPKMEFANGQVVQCTESAGSGEWTSAKDGTQTAIFRNCALVTDDVVGEQCSSSGSAAGEIETSPLDIALVAYKAVGEREPLVTQHFGPNNEVTAENEFEYLEGKVFVNSTVAAGHSYYAEFSCGPTASFRVLGSIAGNVASKLNVPSKHLQWLIGPGKGTQDLYAEFSSDGGASYTDFGGLELSYEARAGASGGLEVIEPL